MREIKISSEILIGIGFLIPSLTIICIDDWVVVPAYLAYFIGTIFPSTIISLLTGIIVFLTFRSSSQKSYKSRLSSGFICLIKTFLVGILLPSIIIAPLLLNDWAGITYMVKLNVWGSDLCRTGITKCGGTRGYSSVGLLAVVSFLTSTVFSLVHSIFNYKKILKAHL